MSHIKRYITALRRYNRSRGFGIHSPFAFYFVRRVLREKAQYYAYESLHNYRNDATKLVKKRQLKKSIISLKNAKMLFRIACYFKPQNILQIGSTYGVSTMSLLTVSQQSRLVIYLGHNACCDIYDIVTASCGNRIEKIISLDSATQRYNTILDGKPAFVLINSVDNDSDCNIAKQVIKSAIDSCGVIIMRNLNDNQTMKQLWCDCCSSAKYGMTFTNYRLGIIVAHKHLPRQNYSLWF